MSALSADGGTLARIKSERSSRSVSIGKSRPFIKARGRPERSLPRIRRLGIDPTKPKLGPIQFLDKDIDHANRTGRSRQRRSKPTRAAPAVPGSVAQTRTLMACCVLPEKNRLTLSESSVTSTARINLSAIEDTAAPWLGEIFPSATACAIIARASFASDAVRNRGNSKWIGVSFGNARSRKNFII